MIPRLPYRWLSADSMHSRKGLETMRGRQMSKEHSISCFGKYFKIPEQDNVFVRGKDISFYQTWVLLMDIYRSLLHALFIFYSA